MLPLKNFLVGFKTESAISKLKGVNPPLWAPNLIPFKYTSALELTAQNINVQMIAGVCLL